MGGLTRSSDFERLIANGQYFEEMISAFYHLWVGEGDKVIDGGASHGMHTCPLSKLVGPSGRVYAFEPIPHLASALKQTCRAYGNVEVHDAAISDFDGWSQFNYVSDFTEYSGLKKRRYPENAVSESINVPVVQIDTLLSALDEVSFVKLDLEGGEFKALKGAQKLISRTDPLIIFEHGGQEAADYNEYEIGDYLEFWADLGYALFDLFGKPISKINFAHHGIWYLIAAKTEPQRTLIDNVHIVMARITAMRDGRIEYLERLVAERTQLLAERTRQSEQFASDLAAIRSSKIWRSTAPVRHLLNKLRGD